MKMVRREDDGVFAPFDFSRRMASLFDDAVSDFALARGGTSFVPAIDIAEDEKAIHIRAELPGMTKENIRVALEEGVLTISGEKRDEREVRSDRYHRTERRFGAFSRAIAVPDTIDPSKISATCKEGVLTIELPRREDAPPRSIDVKVN